MSGDRVVSFYKERRVSVKCKVYGGYSSSVHGQQVDPDQPTSDPNGALTYWPTVLLAHRTLLALTCERECFRDFETDSGPSTNKFRLHKHTR